jgi:hypothetical protein
MGSSKNLLKPKNEEDEKFKIPDPELVQRYACSEKIELFN